MHLGETTSLFFKLLDLQNPRSTGANYSKVQHSVLIGSRKFFFFLMGATQSFTRNRESCVLAVIVFNLHSSHPVVSFLKPSAN